LPAFSAFTTIVELPDIPEEEIANVIRFQAKQYIPLSLSAVTVDWEKVGERSVGGDKNIKQVFLIAMLNEQIERYKNILKLADLKLAAFEIEGLSLARALTLGVTPPVLIIDIGARSSSFSIAQDGLLKFVGQSDFAGASLTQVLSTGLGVNVKRAEDLKKHITPELSTLLNPLLDVIINEARRVKNNYENTYKDPINQIVLAGGGSRLSGIANYIQERLGVPVSKGNPFQKVEYDVKLEPALDDLKISLATSIGLGLRQID
jgi:type IV pilus assembly protein PilM